jgi:hypothetical protein
VGDQQSETFLLRVWAEPRELAGQPSVYRARIEHVRTGRAAYAASLSEFPAFIRECLADVGFPRGGFADEL